ncbi:MAG: hypothetical protein QOI59_3309, partial [Gammaproteobacteria bacterium]|nr:hypothetical protein [Gammaproteobacteria bacterium]
MRNVTHYIRSAQLHHIEQALVAPAANARGAMEGGFMKSRRQFL